MSTEDDPPPILVSIHGLTYAYSDTAPPALDGIDLTIRRGEIIGVVGATGAGKSTLCLTFNGIVPQFFGGRYFGTMRVADADTVDTPTSLLAATVGMVFEDPETQITATTVEAEVAFALENLKVPSPEIVVRVNDALRDVGLEGLQRKHPANLSGGQKQRLAIASALALAPAVIVLDEPTSQLDPIGTSEVFSLLRRLRDERDITIVVASHATEELAETVNRVVLLSAGRVVRDGRASDVLGDVPLLRQHGVRPPDIAQAFHCVAEKSRSVLHAPTTVRSAMLAFESFRGGFTGFRRAEHVQQQRHARPALEAVDLSFTYPDGTQALRGVDLRIEAGEFVAIGGRNGCGKSTLIRHFVHLVEASAGTVRVNGADVAALKVSHLARLIGYVAQNAHQQLFCDSVQEEVAFALRMMKRPSEEIEASTRDALQAMKLQDAADRHPMSLSRGDRLRVAIAAVLALGPEILIFDEPTTGQDWVGSRAILDICRELNSKGKTIVLVTHHLYLLPGYANRMIVMAEGRVAVDGPLEDVLYSGDTLTNASLAPPQTVTYAATIDVLARPGSRPLSPSDLASCARTSAEEAA